MFVSYLPNNKESPSIHAPSILFASTFIPSSLIPSALIAAAVIIDVVFVIPFILESIERFISVQAIDFVHAYVDTGALQQWPTLPRLQSSALIPGCVPPPLPSFAEPLMDNLLE